METQRCRYHLCKLLCLFLFVNNQSGLCNGYKPEMPSTYVKRNDQNKVQHETDEKTNVFRKGKDLIYEAMKMRTGIWPPQGKDLEKVVGGGLLEKQLFSSPAFSHARENPDIAIRFESRGNTSFESQNDHSFHTLSNYCKSFIGTFLGGFRDNSIKKLIFVTILVFTFIQKCNVAISYL